MGGKSAEREVSLNTGRDISRALQAKGYKCTPIDVGEDIVERLAQEQIDVVFVALHGKWGEDGAIQGLLEVLGIPYTGSGVLASALAMNKLASKKVFAYHKIPSPPFYYWEARSKKTLSLRDTGLKLPVVVKPCAEGSSVGVSIVSKSEAWKTALQQASKFGPDVIIEAFIPGREIQVGIFDDRVLGTVEVRPKEEFYDYKAKYTPGRSEYDVPAPLEETVEKEVREIALKAHRSLGCEGVSRVDFRLDPEGNVFILEVNTIPGMTATSLVPKIAKEAGISYEELAEKILLGAGLKIVSSEMITTPPISHKMKPGR